MDPLRLDVDQAYNISRAVGNDAQELREELAGLQRDWDNLSREWSGVASSAYSAIWSEWLEGATTLVDAWPGDVIGLANAASLRPGDTLYRDVPVQYPPIPSFSPEHFAVARGADPSKHKQFRQGIEQLEQEGVVQVLRSDRRGDQAPVLAAVGPMQFEVAVHRMATELSAPISLESLHYQVARIVDPADAEFMDKQVSSEVLTRTDGVMLVLFSTPWRLEGFQRDNPDVKLGSLVAAEG
jgi:peptide chain release factor 3